MPSMSTLDVLILITLLVVAVSPTIAAVSNDSVPCSVLSSILPGKVSYASDATYSDSVRSYWFEEARLSPDCIVSPTSASEVVLIVKNLAGKRTSNSSFAIRSGGHTPFAGAANIESGVTIDLRAMNYVNLSTDYTVASAGAGSSWDNIYQKLQPLNLTVVGGRVAGLGVGGLTTGGWSMRLAVSLISNTNEKPRWNLVSLASKGICLRQRNKHRARPCRRPDS